MPLSDSRQRRLLEDILSGRFDTLDLARRRKLSVEQLSEWMNDPENHRLLAGLVTLADLQTQWTLSRYRATAAHRLIKLAASKDESKGEAARRACVDLLRLDMALPRVAPGEVAEMDDDAMNALREMLYESGNSGEGECEKEDGEGEEDEEERSVDGAVGGPGRSRKRPRRPRGNCPGAARRPGVDLKRPETR